MNRPRNRRASSGTEAEDETSAEFAPHTPALDARLAAQAERVVVVCLSIVLAASLLVPLLLTGRPHMWSLGESLLPSAAVTARIVGITSVLIAALFLFEWAHRQIASRAARVLVIAAAAIAVTATFFALGPLTYIGDWQWMLGVADEGKPLGKWYGASLCYGWFHRLINLFTAALPMTSIRLFSSLCGALTAYVWFRTVKTLDLTRTLAAWPFLFLSAFGIIGVGLSHAEIYAPVVLLFCLLLWSGIVLLEDISPMHVLLFALLGGVSLSFYATMLFAVPAVVVVLGWCGWTGIRRADTRVVAASAAGLLLLALPTLLAQVAGPEPTQGHLASFWMAKLQQEGVVGALPDAKHFHPDDVFWPVLAHFMNPKYLFSSWHLRDIGQHALLDDRVGVVLAPALLLLVLSRRALRPALRAHIVFLAGLSAIFCGYGFWLVNGKPYPWDWDLISYTVLPLNVLTAALLARLCGQGRYGRTTNALLVTLGILSMAAGLQFMSRYPDRPASFGPPQHGLSLGVTPAEMTYRPGQPLHLWLWLRNESDELTVVHPEPLRIGLVAESRDYRLVLQSRPWRVGSPCYVPAGGEECLKDLLFKPSMSQVDEMPGSTAPPPEDELSAATPPGEYRARVVIDLGRDEAGVSRMLRSDILQLTISR